VRLHGAVCLAATWCMHRSCACVCARAFTRVRVFVCAWESKEYVRVVRVRVRVSEWVSEVARRSLSDERYDAVTWCTWSCVHVFVCRHIDDLPRLDYTLHNLRVCVRVREWVCLGVCLCEAHRRLARHYTFCERVCVWEKECAWVCVCMTYYRHYVDRGPCTPLNPHINVKSYL